MINELYPCKWCGKTLRENQFRDKKNIRIAEINQRCQKCNDKFGTSYNK